MTENTCEPADPTVGGWHWLERGGDPVPAKWVRNAEGTSRGPWRWQIAGAWDYPDYVYTLGYRYHSPCPTPAEMVEREKAWAKDRADLVLYYENLADERDAAEAERDGLLRALASAFAGRWEDRNVNFREGRAGLFADAMQLTALGLAAVKIAEEAT